MFYTSILFTEQEALYSVTSGWRGAGYIADSDTCGGRTPGCSGGDYGGDTRGGGCFILSGQVMGPIYYEKEV